MWNYFFRVCILNRTSVYLRLFDYVSDQLCTAFFILAKFFYGNTSTRRGLPLCVRYNAHVLVKGRKSAFLS